MRHERNATTTHSDIAIIFALRKASLSYISCFNLLADAKNDHDQNQVSENVSRMQTSDRHEHLTQAFYNTDGQIINDPKLSQFF